MQQRWLAVWLDNWPIQRRRGGEAVAAQQGDAKPAEAAAERVDQAGMVDAAPLLLWHEDSRADSQALRRIADALLLEISPLVALEPQPERAPWAGLQRSHSESLLINISGIGDWFGSEQAVLQATGRLLQRRGLRAAMAIADTSAAAWGIARFGGRDLQLVPAGQTAQAVDPLPIQSLRITAEVAHQLDRLGIKTVGQLRRLPRSGLATRLGDELVQRMDQMLGLREEPLVMHHSEPEDVAVCELEYPTTDIEILRHRIGQLIDTLAARLAAEVRGALRLACHLEILEGHPPQQIDVGLFAPTADAEHLRRLMMAALEGKRLPAMVQRVSVSVDLAGPLRQFQTMLFGEESTSDVAARRGLARMIETVAMRLGRDAVLAVLPSDHPLPEAAYVLRPLAGQSDQSGDGFSDGASGSRRRRRGSGQGDLGAIKSPRRALLPAPIGPLPSDPLRRPLRLFTRPLSIAVVISPSDGVLTRLRIGGLPGDPGPGRSYRVLRCCGPERIETTAAGDGAIRRDYYRVEIEGGAWFWLFRHWGAGRAETWYLHGRFD